MRQQLLCGVAAIAIAASTAGTTLAADLPRKAPPAPAPVMMPPPTWAGFYVGGHLGWARADFDATYDFNGDLFPFDTRQDSLVGGMHAGYNWQFNSFVLGVEGDVSAVGGRRAYNTGFYTDNPVAAHTDLDALASLRGRLGWAFNNVLIYGTGGLAYARANAAITFTSARIAESRINKWGAVAGGGIEYKINQNFSVRGEALYYWIDKSVAFVNHDDSQRASFELKNALVARFGATYHFTPW